MKAMCSFATIVMNRPTNNLLEFQFHRQPKPSLFISSDTKCSSANYKLAAVSSFNRVISLHPKNSVEHWTSHTEMHFFRLAKALQQFLCRKPRCWAILEKYRRCRLFLCVAAIVVLFFSNTTICISPRFYCRAITFVIWMIDFTAKML